MKFYGIIEIKELLNVHNYHRVLRKLMELILAGLSYELAWISLHSTINFRNTFDEHLSRLELVFYRIKEVGLKIESSNCRFFS